MVFVWHHSFAYSWLDRIMDRLNPTVIGNNDNSLTIDEQSSYSTQISNLKSISLELASQLQQNGNGQKRRRTLPLLAEWTIVCDDLRSASPRNRISQRLEDEIIKLIQISNGRQFPLPLWIFGRLKSGGSKEVKRIKKRDVKFRTALTFYCSPWYKPIFRRIALTLFRNTCPFFPEGGPILAHQRGRRLPDRSLITLIALEYDHRNIIRTYDRDVWTSNWKNGSILPQRAIFNRSGETHIIGILHQQLHYAATSRFRPEQHLQLASALIPHSRCYHNTPMLIGRRGSLKLTPIEIATFQVHQQLMEQLLSFGAILSIHPNEVKLRQLLRTRVPTFLVSDLPYKRLNDFEIDWKSADVIRQGQHSRVYKASSEWIDKGTTKYESCAVKIIPLTETTTIEKVAREITIIDRLTFPGVNQLIGLEANAEYVAIITPFANGGTLEDYLPTLLKEKHDIINNNENDTLTIDQRRIKYLHHIHPIVDRLFDRLIHHSDRRVLHRDLRLSNIVFNSVSEIDPKYVHIIDYGHATRVGRSGLDEDKQRSDDPYLYCVNAPEVVNGGKYTFASEMWSFGMILLSLWTCQKPFNNELLTNSLVGNTLISVSITFSKRSLVMSL
jgi:hypothetical protein